MEGYEVIPSAKRLIRSLRDMGYDFGAAVADLVDNSIEAGATLVAIDIEFDGDDSLVRIADNGRGMRPEQLREAMRFGSERDYGEDSLGKFGLGLKTASMSQCQRLSVASRSNPARADVAGYCWDLEHIERTNRWEILPLQRDGVGHAARQPLKDTTGTVVVWQQLDRILGYEHPYGLSARKRLSLMCREVEVHLAMVFHRFLGGEVRHQRPRLMLNGNEIQGWDPFCRTERATKALDPIRLAVEYEGATGEIVLEPFVLPHQDDFSSPDAFRRASGPANWNQQQGFYIYRNGRMIQSGGWCRLRTADEHTKLARVGLSFSPVLDEAFKINVSKMRVQLPSAAREEIAQAIVSVARTAREVYDRKARARSDPKGPGKGQESLRNTSVGSGGPAGSGAPAVSSRQVQLTLDQLTGLLMKIATPAERPVIEELIRRLEHVLGVVNQS